MKENRDVATHYRTQEVDGVKIFYREAGPVSAPTILLLHGFPTSSHMFRDLIPRLAPHFRVIAPDLPGFGFSDAPAPSEFSYTFGRLADVMKGFTEALGLERYALYLFDYSAPIGLRLALKNPHRVTAIVSQNGNAYEEGLSEAWAPLQKYWKTSSPENRAALRGLLAPETTKWLYTHGTDESRVAPESYWLDSALLARPGNEDIQLDLFLDYASNVELYPEFQKYFAVHQPPTLAVWGKSDPFFLPAGAQAFQRDNPGAQVEFFDAGHFALETHSKEIGDRIITFLTSL